MHVHLIMHPISQYCTVLKGACQDFNGATCIIAPLIAKGATVFSPLKQGSRIPPNLLVIGVQPEMIQGIFSYITGDTRDDSTSQLLIVRIHTHHSVGSYQNKLWNRCTGGGLPI